MKGEEKSAAWGRSRRNAKAKADRKLVAQSRSSGVD